MFGYHSSHVLYYHFDMVKNASSCGNYTCPGIDHMQSPVYEKTLRVGTELPDIHLQEVAGRWVSWGVPIGHGRTAL
jgi:hypothetical protein